MTRLNHATDARRGLLSKPPNCNDTRFSSLRQVNSFNVTISKIQQHERNNPKPNRTGSGNEKKINKAMNEEKKKRENEKEEEN